MITTAEVEKSEDNVPPLLKCFFKLVAEAPTKPNIPTTFLINGINATAVHKKKNEQLIEIIRIRILIANNQPAGATAVLVLLNS